MKRWMAHLYLSFISSILLIISICRPNFLDDTNVFLKNFANHESIAILGIVVSITLASISQIHLALTELERAAGTEIFHSTKAGLRSSTKSLLLLFSYLIAISVIKGALQGNQFATLSELIALINSSYILTIFWSLLEMASIIGLVFKIPPKI